MGAQMIAAIQKATTTRAEPLALSRKKIAVVSTLDDAVAAFIPLCACQHRTLHDWFLRRVQD